MRRFIPAALAALLLVPAARAHFVFLVPEADGTKAKAILSDDLEPDSGVDIGGIAATKLQVRAGNRRVSTPDAAITWTKGEHAFNFAIPGQGPRVVFGTTDYGVMQRGESKPFLLRYHPKAIIGDIGAVKPLGDSVPVEIVPDGSAGAIRFRVLARGKPLADAEVTVIASGAGQSKKVTTDAEGRTPEFKQTGRYGAWARFVEAKSGEHAGKKYEESRHYATLVVDVGPGRAGK